MTIAPVNRWLYRGQRPNWIARLLNGAGLISPRANTTAYKEIMSDVA